MSIDFSVYKQNIVIVLAHTGHLARKSAQNAVVCGHSMRVRAVHWRRAVFSGSVHVTELPTDLRDQHQLYPVHVHG